MGRVAVPALADSPLWVNFLCLGPGWLPDGNVSHRSGSQFESNSVALSNFDRELVAQCLEHHPNSWESFVHRFMGLMVHVIRHTAQARSIRLTSEDCEDLCAEVFLTILQDDFAVLRQFRGESSLATYLTVIARRVVVRSLVKMRAQPNAGIPDEIPDSRVGRPIEQRISDRDAVERLLNGLGEQEAEVIRQFHLEGRSYREISTNTGVPENSIGPTLSRARAKLRNSQTSPQ